MEVLNIEVIPFPESNIVLIKESLNKRNSNIHISIRARVTQYSTRHRVKNNT